MSLPSTSPPRSVQKRPQFHIVSTSAPSSPPSAYASFSYPTLPPLPPTPRISGINYVYAYTPLPQASAQPSKLALAAEEEEEEEEEEEKSHFGLTDIERARCGAKDADYRARKCADCARGWFSLPRAVTKQNLTAAAPAESVLTAGHRHRLRDEVEVDSLSSGPPPGAERYYYSPKSAGPETVDWYAAGGPRAVNGKTASVPASVSGSMTTTVDESVETSRSASPAPSM